MTSKLVYVVGPSGAGKDSLLLWLREQLPPSAPVHWAQRTITRAANAGGENHESVSHSEFFQISTQHGFAMQWDANGLRYGIRHSQVEPLEKMHWVFVNGSRAHLNAAYRRYPGMVSVLITASPEVLKTRLLARGREEKERIDARMDRTIEQQWPANCPFIEVTNNTSLEASGTELLQKLRQLPDWPP